MKRIVAFMFIFIAVNVFAQDYYLTAGKNKTPLKVKTAADISKILKLQNKDTKYRSIVLSVDKKQAVYILVPASLNVRLDNNSFVITNYDIDNDDTEGNKVFDINVSFKKSVDNMEQNINKLSEEENRKIPLDHISKVYGRTKFEEYSFFLNDTKIIVLQAPYAGNFVEFVYMAPQPKDKYAKPNNKGEAVLGIAASSLNKAVLTESADMSLYEVAGLSETIKNGISQTEDDSGQKDPVLESWTVNKISARQNSYYFEIKDNYNSTGYTFTLPSNISPEPEGSIDARIIIDKTENSEMWFELVYKNSEKYNNEVVAKYLNGKKLSNKKKIKFKAGGKNINFIKRNALNANAYNYFFTVEGKKFVLSFVAPSDKLPAYEQISGAFLKTFKNTAVK